MFDHRKVVYTDTESDYPKGYVRGSLTITKMRNALRKAGLELAKGGNIRLNGVRTGCSGFVRDPATGLLAYFCAEGDRPYYRSAYGLDDYTGGSNWNCDNEGLVRGIHALLIGGRTRKAGDKWGNPYSHKSVLAADVVVRAA